MERGFNSQIPWVSNHLETVKRTAGESLSKQHWRVEKHTHTNLFLEHRFSRGAARDCPDDPKKHKWQKEWSAVLVFTLSLCLRLLRHVSINKISRRTLVTDNDVIDPLECLREVSAPYTSPLLISLAAESVFRLCVRVSQVLVCNVQNTHPLTHTEYSLIITHTWCTAHLKNVHRLFNTHSVMDCNLKTLTVCHLYFKCNNWNALKYTFSMNSTGHGSLYVPVALAVNHMSSSALWLMRSGNRIEVVLGAGPELRPTEHEGGGGIDDYMFFIKKLPQVKKSARNSVPLNVSVFCSTSTYASVKVRFAGKPIHFSYTLGMYNIRVISWGINFVLHSKLKKGTIVEITLKWLSYFHNSNTFKHKPNTFENSWRPSSGKTLYGWTWRQVLSDWYTETWPILRKNMNRYFFLLDTFLKKVSDTW